MKSLELEADKGTLYETFRTDTIGRNEYLVYFIELLDNVEGNFSIALDGDWGIGKSFFVKQAKMILDAYNEYSYDFTEERSKEIQNIFEQCQKRSNSRQKESILQVAVYYDAWENDNNNDPLISLLYCILEATIKDYKFVESKFSIDKQKLIKEVFSGIIKHFFSIDIKALLNSINEESKDLFKVIKEEKQLKERINEFFKLVLSEHGERLVIFIDELDRCKPTFAIQLLERIKHYLKNPLITFVFSTNIKQLQYTVKKYYGNDFEAKRYLDKFFDIQVTLNQFDVEKYFDFVGINKQKTVYDMICKEVIQMYNFTLRDINKFRQVSEFVIKKVKIGSNALETDETQGIKYGLCCILPLMIALKIKDYKLYEDFITGKNYTPLTDLMIKRKLNLYINDRLLSREEQNLEEKLILLYEAIFKNSYLKEDNIQIGSMSFNRYSKKILLEVDSLLSEYAKYD